MSFQHIEQQDPEISVIIPIFNGYKYIDKLVENIKKQTYKNYEVIFVDDGSEDDSFEKLLKYYGDLNEDISQANRGIEAYQGVYNISVRIYKQENKGQGEARNLGIEKARGKWLCFMDQDDAIEPDYLKRLHNEVEKNGDEACDILISGYKKLSKEGRLLECVRFTNSEWCRYMNIAPWGKLYLRDFIMVNGIRYQPLVLGEDIYFNVCCYMASPRVHYTDYAGYLWIMNDESVSNSVHTKASKEVSILILFDRLSKLPEFDEWIKEEMNAYFMLKTGIFHILYSAADTDIDTLFKYEKKVFEWLKENVSGVEENRFISIWKPDGERFHVRFIVYVYMLCREIGLNRFLLRVINAVR